jgi:hypothetical protein
VGGVNHLHVDGHALAVGQQVSHSLVLERESVYTIANILGTRKRRTMTSAFF